MANIKITGLNELITPTLTDVFPIVNGGDTKKVKLSTVKETLGINNLDNVTKYLTAETVGDTSIFNININNPIVSGLILYIKFPNNFWTSLAVLKINNDTTYNIQQNGSNIRGIDVSNKYLTLRYDGSNWQTENLNTRLSSLETKVGDVSTLATTSKVVVGAINEVEARVDTVETDIDKLQTGWNSAGETWTYASVDDPTGNITISGDVTTKYSLGMRIKFTNGGNTIFGIITKIAYSSPNTTLTFLHEINPSTNTALHLMANSAITNNYYSNMKVPFGFPSLKLKWTMSKDDSTTYTQNSPNGSQFYNLGTIYIDVPIGSWELSYNATIQPLGNGTVVTIGRVAVSTDNAMTTTRNGLIAGTLVGHTVRAAFFENSFVTCVDYNNTAKTRLYLMEIMANDTSNTSLKLLGADLPTQIKITCAYL